MIETDTRNENDISKCNKDIQIRSTQIQFINHIVDDIRNEAINNLEILIKSGQLNNLYYLKDLYMDFIIAKAVVNIAIKNVNKKWHTNCHFNSTCKMYEEVIKEEFKV